MQAVWYNHGVPRWQPQEHRYAMDGEDVMMDRMSSTLEPPANELNSPEEAAQPGVEDSKKLSGADKNLPEGIAAQSVIEALLLATDEPLTAAKIAQLLGTGDATDVKEHIRLLNERYEQTGASFRIEAIAKGYQVLTLPVYNTWIQKLHKARDDSRLSPAALETLAIVAYKQPILRADVEAIRGVAVGDMLVRLRDMGLVRIVGRAEEVGRPLLYGTTTKFLDIFGLSSLKDLPKVDSDQPGAVPKIKLAE